MESNILENNDNSQHILTNTRTIINLAVFNIQNINIAVYCFKYRTVLLHND